MRDEAGRGPGEAFRGNAPLDTGTDEEETGIRNAGRAGVGDEGHVLPVGQTLDETLHLLMLVELVVREEGGGNAVMLQEDGSGARVLGKDKTDFPEHANGTKRDVFQITHGGGHEIKFGHNPYFDNFSQQK